MTDSTRLATYDGSLGKSDSQTPHLALLVELPSVYMADVDDYRAWQAEEESESDYLLNIVGEPSVVRVRMEISGEKDSEVVEVWGSVREAQLVKPSRGYNAADAHLTEEQLAEHGWRLMPDA